MTFGETIRQLRLLANMNQLQLALDWGKSISTVSRIESNQAMVRLNDLPGLALVLHTTTDYLLQCVDQRHALAADLVRQEQTEKKLLEQKLRQKEQEANRLFAEIEELRKQLAPEAV